MTRTLNDRLDSIVESVKDGQYFEKSASEISDSLKGLHFEGDLSSFSGQLKKLAHEVRHDSGVSYSDINEFVYGEDARDSRDYGVSGNTRLHKLAHRIRTSGIDGKQEKIASMLDASVGLSLLRAKMVKQAEGKKNELKDITAGKAIGTGAGIGAGWGAGKAFSTIRSPENKDFARQAYKEMRYAGASRKAAKWALRGGATLGAGLITGRNALLGAAVGTGVYGASKAHKYLTRDK